MIVQYHLMRCDLPMKTAIFIATHLQNIIWQFHIQCKTNSICFLPLPPHTDQCSHFLLHMVICFSCNRNLPLIPHPIPFKECNTFLHIPIFGDVHPNPGKIFEASKHTKSNLLKFIFNEISSCTKNTKESHDMLFFTFK